VLFLIALLCPGLAFAGTLPGESLSLWWTAPFGMILLSLAIGPLFFANLWHHHYGKIIFGFTGAFLIPALQTFGMAMTLHQVLHHLLLEYVPFVILIAALFVVTGSIRLKANWLGTPAHNTLVLAFGAATASFIGTTGASMLLIRPLIRANGWRAQKKHIFIFFIFLVSNVGGCLTPLGDPPLFLGFLEGVPFTWPFVYLSLPFLVTSSLLLGVFYTIDHHFYKKEGTAAPFTNDGKEHGITACEGRRNFLLLAGILGAVLLSGTWKSGVSFDIAGVPLTLESLAREGLLVLIIFVCLLWTKPIVRKENHFSWEPLLEVAKIFLGIFITVIPAISILKAGTDGALSPFVSLANQGGMPYNPAYFWLSGLFSSFLDNAPTYFVFFHMAGGDVATLTTSLCKTLLAISMGSVFMGAITYIGNAPNFMVKSIVEKRGIKMPSFFGYMAWSCACLLPIFALLTWMFF
jgi:Na+/H+ antiporter NhaD/arsenite permease-like protein